MDFLWDKITEWLKEMLIGGIVSNLSGMFDATNQKVAEISGQVGLSPQAWNGSIFSMIQNLSETVIVPIAGAILAFVMTLELIQLITDKNNLNDMDTWIFFKWAFKSAAAVLIVTNTWTIVMGVFDAAQSVVASASGLIIGDTSINISSVMVGIEDRLMEMELGPLFGLWFQSLFVGITMWALTICIFIITFGRMIEIYLVTSVAPIPMATMMGKEWGGMGQNYIRSLLALVFSQLTGISMSILTFFLNAILLVIGFLLIGKDFGAKTIYTSILLPIFLWIFERLIPVTESVTGNQVFDLVTYTLIVALGQAMLFHVNASSGGLDIVAKILNKFAHMELGKAVMLSGFVTAMTSILVYDVPTLIVSLLGTYANGMAVDYFIDGFNKRKRVCIISDDYKEIQNYIIHDLKRGATLYVAQGAYDEKHRTELVTILAQQEYRLLLNYLHTTKKDVFVTVSTVNEVIGQWNAK